jgi:hypothetical protein
LFGLQGKCSYAKNVKMNILHGNQWLWSVVVSCTSTLCILLGKTSALLVFHQTTLCNVHKECWDIQHRSLQHLLPLPPVMHLTILPVLCHGTGGLLLLLHATRTIVDHVSPALQINLQIYSTM